MPTELLTVSKSGPLTESETVKWYQIYEDYLVNQMTLYELTVKYHLSSKEAKTIISWAGKDLSVEKDAMESYAEDCINRLTYNLKKLNALADGAREDRDKIEAMKEMRQTINLQSKLKGVKQSGEGKGAVNIFLPDIKRGEGVGTVVVEQDGEKCQIST